ncbi:helix-turn-helix domain-containing protein [Streptomyces sp. SID3343]|nr:helix-turn-helix domain-containing protein [Streptomyces sp. SID3343]
MESVDNALRLVLLLRAEQRLRVADAAERLGVARSTAHRLLGMLKQHGFAVQDSSRVYRPGPALLGPAAGEYPERDLAAVLRPHLERLNTEIGETVHLMVLQGNSVRFVDGVEGSNILRVGLRVGMLLPAHCTSGGKALLAELPAAELRALYPRGLPIGVGPAITDLPAFRRQLTTIRRRGYAVNFEESERGITAVGVTLHDPADRPVGAIAVVVPTARCPRPRVPELADALRQTAQRAARDI